jgi:FkbM family methyltransferase
MDIPCPDLTRSLRMFLRHRLIGIRDIPIRGTRRLSKLAEGLIGPPQVKGLCIVKTIHGFKMLVDPVTDHGVERSIFSAGTYERGTLHALDGFLSNGGTFIDVGANVGLMTLFAAMKLRSSGHVVAFEAMPSTFEILWKNIELNGFSNVTAVNVAVGSATSTAEIFDDREMRRGAATLLRPSQGVHGWKVPITSLDEYLTANSVNDVTCVKVDVEGWELEVLRGAPATLHREKPPIWIFECSRQHAMFAGSVEDLYDMFMETKSYQVYRLARGKERPSRMVRIAKHELPNHDNIFCLTPEHVSKLPASARPLGK